MYNLTVDEAHTFFVGDGQWLVHNCRVKDSNDPDFLKHVEERQNGDNWYDSREFETGVQGEYSFDHRNPGNDLDMRGPGYSPEQAFEKALDQAFANTGYSRERFTVTKWAIDPRTGKKIPVEYVGPNHAQVSVDYPHLSPDQGPDVPHIGWEVDKKANRQKGHIFLDWVPAGRPPR